MEDNIFILSDASYSSHTKLTGLGVIDTFTQKRYQLSLSNIKSAYEAEFNALALSIKIAIENGYSNVVFVYDCKNLEVNSLKEYAKRFISNVQFLWLKRKYLNESDSLAKQARKLVEKFSITKASNEDLEIIKKHSLEKSVKKLFMSYTTSTKLKAILHIANKREKEIINAFLSSSSINLNVKNKLGSKNATLMKFIYHILMTEDQISFLHYLTYVNPDLNKKSFRKSLKDETERYYFDRIFTELKNKKEI